MILLSDHRSLLKLKLSNARQFESVFMESILKNCCKLHLFRHGEYIHTISTGLKLSGVHIEQIIIISEYLFQLKNAGQG